MNHESGARLLGDIGGTNARFGWQSRPGAPIVDVATLACAEHDSLQSAIRHYLSSGDGRRPQACAIAIANPIVGDRVQMTNHHWSFSIAALQQELGVQRLAVINDFTALALSLPAIAATDLHQIGRGDAVAHAPMAVLGPGTGLGVSGLLPVGKGGFVPIAGEGGHVTLAPSNSHEAAVLEALRQRFGHASAERALSGPGLVNLYDAACGLSGQKVQASTPAEVIEGARRSADPSCVAARDLFFSFLGNVAGNLALTLGARGGVFIGGGIVRRLIEEIDHSEFRERFEGKGRFRDFLAGIPTYVIGAATSPALEGAARALDMEP